jgi:hypothetical protein
MPTVTLLIKVYNSFQQKLIEKFLKSMLKGLKVKIEIRGVTSRRWVQTTVSGEDETVALHYLEDEIGLCPTRLERLRKFSTIKGRITSLYKSRIELRVDIGVFSPDIVDATILLQHLQGQLVDGRKTSLKKLAELFGFCENLPVSVKIHNVDEENRRIETMLSERQLIRYKGWAESLLDRLIVSGASFNEVMLALKKTRCNRDIVNIETLGFFEHAIVCKLGTDAVGLIPKMGKNLRNASFSTFSPRKIMEFLGDYLIL